MPNFHLHTGDALASLQTRPGVSLLDEALASGVNISYSCRRGDCGQCTGALLSGEVAPLDAGRPCLDGETLYLCNASALSDVSVRMAYYPELQEIRVQRSPCKIHELHRISEKVMLVGLRLPPAVKFRYLPGQYIRLTNKERVTRSYSLASAPREDGQLFIHVKRLEGGAFSSYLFERAKPGDLLQLEGPSGHFFLHQDALATKTIFLATGTGFAPIYAILSALTPSERARCGDLYLYWGNRTPGETYFLPELDALANQLNLRYFSLFSRKTADHPGSDIPHVQDLMAAHHADLSSGQVFACGNPAMIDASRRRAAGAGLLSGRFFADPFTSS